VIALLVRLWFIAETRWVPWFRTPGPGGDVDLHWQGARELRHAMAPHFALMEMSAPLHVFLVAIEQTLLGESALALRLASVPVGVATVAVVHRLTLGGTRSRWAAAGVGLIAACLPSLIYFDTVPFKVSFEILMLASALAVVGLLPRVAGDRRRIALGACLGLLLAALCLSQLNGMLETAVLILMLATDRESTPHARRTALVPAAAIIAACLGGFAMRDHLGEPLAHTFLPQAGIHMREGFRPDSVVPGIVPGVGNVGRDHVFKARIVAEQDIGRALTPAETNAYHVRMALRSIADHPAMAARTLGGKARLFFSDTEYKVHVYAFDELRRAAWALRAPVGFGALMILGALGAMRLVEQREARVLAPLAAVVGAVFVVNMAAQVTSRYRLHAVVPLLLLSGHGMLLIVERWRSQVLRRAWAPLAAAIVLGVLAYSPLPEEVRVSPVPLAVIDTPSLRAEKQLGELAGIHETDTEASLHRARLLIDLRRDSEAMAELRRVVDGQGPVDLWAARTFLDYLLLLGRYDDAGSFVDRMTRLDHDLGSRLLYGRDALMQWVLDVLVLHRSPTMPYRSPAVP